MTAKNKNNDETLLSGRFGDTLQKSLFG